MSGFPVLSARPGRLSAPSRQYYRSSSGSPTRQQHYQLPPDDLIPQLVPAKVVEALQYPNGALKTCLDAATVSEQSFAMRAALASRSFQEWLDELSQWPWPNPPDSSGFEEPKVKRQYLQPASGRPISSRPPPFPSLVLTDPVTPERQISRVRDPFGSGQSEEAEEEAWMGSLRAADVMRYEERVAEVQREIDDLEVEDMKQHVLHHHILPLSPPGRPLTSDSLRRLNSPAHFAKMDDFTAVVAAIVLQGLPLLAKLVRLLDSWHIRILVLKKIPLLLESLDGAEAAIQSAWQATRFGDEVIDAGRPSTTSGVAMKPSLRREDLSLVKLTVEKRVSQAAQIADYMLDILDGWEDTIPESWVDRIDKAEREYGEWVAACDRMLRESEWKKAVLNKPILLPPQQKPVIADAFFASQGNDTNSKEASPAYKGQQDEDLPEGWSPDTTRITIATADATGFDGSPRSLSPQSSFGSLQSELSLPAIHDVAPPAKSNKARSVGRPGDFNNTPDASPQHLAVGRERSPSSSPLEFRGSIRSAVAFSDMPTVNEIPDEEEPTLPKTPIETSFMNGDDAMDLSMDMGTPDTRRMSLSSEDYQLQQQISEILESIPAKIRLSSKPSAPLSHLNPPDFSHPRKSKSPADGMRSTSSMSSRSMTPSFLLAPADTRNTRHRQRSSHHEIKLYHLSRSTGEPPIKLFIRLVGEQGERVMVRVGGGWADLSEYLKEYASHHNRRSKGVLDGKVEVRDMSTNQGRVGSSPPSHPGSAQNTPLATPPLIVRKVRRSIGEESVRNQRMPLAALARPTDTPPSESSLRSRPSSRLSWTEEDSSLGMSGPRAKHIEMSDESKAWVESVKEKVRLVSGELIAPEHTSMEGKFGEIGKIGGTKRVFRKA